MYHADGIADAVTFKLSPGIRGPDHPANKGHYKCVDESNCDEETYFLCAQAQGASVDYLYCADGADGTAASKAKQCAASNKPALDFDKMTACFSGDQGKALKKAAADHFDQRFPGLIGVPHIEIDGTAFPDSEPRTEAAIIKLLCATGIKAGACSKAANATLSYL